MILSVSRSVHAASSYDAHIRDLLGRIEKENCLIELPFASDVIALSDLTLYIKAQLNTIQQTVGESHLQALARSVYQQLDKQTQIFYLLRLILHESYFSYLAQERRKLDLTNLNLDEILNAYIGRTTVVRVRSFRIVSALQTIASSDSVRRSVPRYSTTSVRRNRPSARSNCSTFSRATTSCFSSTSLAICPSTFAFRHRYGSP